MSVSFSVVYYVVTFFRLYYVYLVVNKVDHSVAVVARPVIDRMGVNQGEGSEFRRILSG